MLCHHQLEEYLNAYLHKATLTGAKSWLFCTCAGRTGTLTDRPLAQSDVYRMISRRAEAAGVRTHVGCHSFRATGITEYLLAGGRLDVAQTMASHESARTTALYDRREDRIILDEVERLSI
jgi:integrase